MVHDITSFWTHSFSTRRKVCFWATQVDNFGTPITILLLDNASFAKSRRRIYRGHRKSHYGPDEGAGTHIRVTDHALPVTLFAQPTVKTSVADPGCLSRIADPDFYPSRIPDPDPGSKNSNKRERWKKLVVIPFYVATNFTKL
jgi:hypothetical protein